MSKRKEGNLKKKPRGKRDIHTLPWGGQNEEILLFLKDWIYQLADDKLTIGHRDSEWLGMCPDIEGDVAFSSIAQDEVGHAVFFFDVLHALGEEDPDILAFTRSISARRNAVLLERPNGDWAYSVVRHYFYDVFDHIRLQSMMESRFTPLQHGVIKILGEEKYHMLHLNSWFIRLGGASEDARDHVMRAVLQVWKELPDLFCCGRYEKQLLQAGIIQYDSTEMISRWTDQMQPIFKSIGLQWPGDIQAASTGGRFGMHTEALSQLLSTMSEVYRLEPAAGW